MSLATRASQKHIQVPTYLAGGSLLGLLDQRLHHGPDPRLVRIPMSGDRHGRRRSSPEVGNMSPMKPASLVKRRDATRGHRLPGELHLSTGGLHTSLRLHDAPDDERRPRSRPSDFVGPMTAVGVDPRAAEVVQRAAREAQRVGVLTHAAAPKWGSDLHRQRTDRDHRRTGHTLAARTCGHLTTRRLERCWPMCRQAQLGQSLRRLTFGLCASRRHALRFITVGQDHSQHDATHRDQGNEDRQSPHNLRLRRQVAEESHGTAPRA